MEETKISPTRKRPPGITLIALLLCIQGVLEVVLALVLLLIVTRIPWAVAGFIVSAIIGLVCLALARGLWTLKPWAFGATVVLQILSIVYPLFNLVLMLPKNTFITTVGNLIFPVAILIYLFADKNVRAAFQR
jgi:hypothetical protein